MAGALAAIRSSMSARDRLQLSFGSHAHTVGLYCQANGPIKKDIREQLRASYPDLSLIPIDDNSWPPPPSKPLHQKSLHLLADVFPIASLVDYDDQLTRERNDPVAGLLNVVAGDSVRDWARILIDIEPAPRQRTLAARRIVDRYYGSALSRQARRGMWFIRNATSRSRLRRTIARCLAASCYPVLSPLRPPCSKSVFEKGDADSWLVRITLQVATGDEATASRRLQELAGSFARFTASGDAEFVMTASRRKPRGFLLTCEELALIWHPPTQGVRAERQQITGSRQLQPPPVLPAAAHPECDGVALGEVSYAGRSDEVAVTRDDRRKHVYLIGKTGVGKSTVMENMIYQDLSERRGVGVFDPHGQLIDNVLRTIPRHRTNSLVLFDPAGATMGFNPLQCPDPSRRDLVASGFVSALSKLFDLNAAATPRLLYILRNNVLALLEQENPAMLDVMRMLNDGPFRQRIVQKVADPIVKAFWDTEFASWTDRYRQEALPAIQNKIGQLLTSPILRAVFSTERKSLDLRAIMDRQQVLLVNGSKGKLGQDNAAVLMALMISSLEQTAIARADVSEAERPDFYCYCDEFQNYSGTESFETILSEARKYRLCLTLAHQYLGQIQDAAIEAAVFGNVGTICAMRLGRDDAERLAREMSFESPPEIRPEDLLALPKHRALVSLSLHGHPQRPFSMATRPPVKRTKRHARLQTLLNHSRRQAAFKVITT